MTAALLQKFDFTNLKSPGTTETEAIHLLSAQFPNPKIVNLNEIKDEWTGWNLLHHACRNKWFEVVKLLTTKYKCKPNAKSKNGKTPLHCACTKSTSSNLQIVQYLIKEQHSDPEIKDIYGETPLHSACKSGDLEIVQCLISEHHCAAETRDGDGETPLHYACKYGNLRIVQYLISKHNCDPESKDRFHKTPLHYINDIDIAQYLIGEHHCDPNRKSKDDWTPLHDACSNGHLDFVKFLVNKCNSDPFKSNSDGETPFSLAYLGGYDNVVSFLFSSTSGKLNKLIAESEQKPPVDGQESQDQVVLSLVSYCNRYRLHPAFKVFVVGNQSAGKSTMVKALENRLTDNSFRVLTNRLTKSKVSGVGLQTAGIIPTHIRSQKLGHIILYDFAGQYEYYSSHAAFLENLASSSGVLFLLVVDISKDSEEVVRTLQYWSSFISNLCNHKDRLPQIIVIGSHADVVKLQGKKPSGILSDTYDKLDRSLANSLMNTRVVINCTQAASSSLSSISDIIATSSQAFHVECEVDMHAHVLNGVLKEKFKLQIAAKFSHISEALRNSENTGLVFPSTLVATLPQDLTTLSEHGQLLYIRNCEDNSVQDSWVIFRKEMLLSDVNGTLFAPEFFKQHHDISNSTGVVPLSEIKNMFPQYDSEMIVSFLTHLEFCHEIGESEASLISSCNSKSDLTESYYFFPALVRKERPEDSSKSIKQASHKSGWCLQRTQEDQFFTLRFLHVLLLQLAFRFALAPDSPKEEKHSSPVVQRECNVWKNGSTDGGIHWLTMDGVEAIVEVVEQSTAVTVVVGCQEGEEMVGVKLRSDLIRMILDIKKKYSGAVKVSEFFINPSDLDDYPLRKLNELSIFSIKTIAKAVSDTKKPRKYLTRKQDSKSEFIKLDTLLYFEPFSFLGFDILTKLFDESNDRKELDAQFLNKLSEAMQGNHNMYTVVSELQQSLSLHDHDQENLKAKSLRLNAVHSYSPSVRDDPAHRCYLILKKHDNHTYSALRSALSKFSVFCGRNPLEIAEVTTPIRKLLDHTNPLNPYIDSPTGKSDDNHLAAGYDNQHSESTDCDYGISLLPKKSDRPSLKDLQLLKCRGGRRLRVIDTVAADWKPLAVSLGFEGPAIECIEMESLSKPIDACYRVFTKWLDGGDGLCEPVTWATLIECLTDTGLMDIAEQLEEITQSVSIRKLLITDTK